SRQPYVRARDRVDLELPGGQATTGRVRSVGKVATTPAADTSGDSSAPTVELIVSLDHPKATGRLDQAPVDASITTEVRRGVLAVPVNALLALAEGGYAVEVEREGTRQLCGRGRGGRPPPAVRHAARPVRRGPGRGHRRRPAGRRPGGGAGMSPEGAP